MRYKTSKEGEEQVRRKQLKIRVEWNPQDMSTRFLWLYYVHIPCMYNLLKYLYICSFIHFSVLFMYNARTEPYTWTYISSVEFVYENLIETKKDWIEKKHKIKRNELEKRNPFSTGWKHRPGLNMPARCNVWGPFSPDWCPFSVPVPRTGAKEGL
jgi:hypothetical protein